MISLLGDLAKCWQARIWLIVTLIVRRSPHVSPPSSGGKGTLPFVVYWWRIKGSAPFINKLIAFLLGHAKGNLACAVHSALICAKGKKWTIPFAVSQLRFFHVDHHALHNDRFGTSAIQIQTQFLVEIRAAFRLISYWKMLRLSWMIKNSVK